MRSNVAFKCNETFSVISIASDPTQIFSPAHEVIVDDDNITIVTSNVSTGSSTSQQSAFSLFAPRGVLPLGNGFCYTPKKQQGSKWAYAAMTMTIASSEAIADSGATQIFVMDGIPVHNKQKTTCPLKVALADGRRVMSTHMCDIRIPGLPTTLVGHLVPELSITSLFGIRVLTEAGCTVKFDIEKCVVKYNGNIILTGMKDPTPDLWTLPIVGCASKTSPTDTRDEQDAFEPLRDEFMERANAACSATTSSLAVPLCTSTQAYTTGGTAKYTLPNPPPNEFGFFTHIIRTKANSIKFAHQSMCSPTISTLLKAIRRGFLDGCPNLSAKGVTSHALSQPEPSHSQRSHETATSRNSKHHRKATAIAPIRQATSNHSSRPDCG
jgi:hypothetical protein